MTRASDTARLLGAGATILDGTTISTADNTAQLTLISTDADANSAPLLLLDRNSSSPADSDRIAEIVLRGRNDAGESIDYIMFDSFITDASDGTEDSELDIRTMVGGSEATRILLDPAETVFNEASIDLDFRVESNGNANMLFVDGGNDRVGIGTSSPNAKLTSATTDGGSAFSIHRDFSGDVGAAETGTGSFNFTLTDTATSDQIVSRINSVAVAGTGDAFAGSMRFYTAGNDGSIAEHMRVTGDGIDFRQTSGTHYVLFKNGDGIHFGATTTGASGASVTGTVLDDYEEGTWTAGFSGATVSISATTGYYTKIGRKVFFNYYADTMNISSASGGAIITGLPFTSSNSSQNYGLFTYVHGTAVSNSKGGFVSKNTTYMTFITDNSTNASTYVDGSNKYAMVAGFYFTDS